MPEPLFIARTLNCRGRLLDLSRPVIMGILNRTPDSFFDGGRLDSLDDVLRQAEKMLHAGAAVLDIGGASSRPGAADVPEDEEKQRVTPAIEAIRKQFPEAVLSVDTWRASVAREALAAGASIINDISAGRFDAEMVPFLGSLSTSAGLYPEASGGGVPYILMHLQGTPKTMQQNPEYGDVVIEVLDFFIAEIAKLRGLGITDIVLDPGFGFGKTVEHNYRLLKNLHVFSAVTGLPVLAGLSRKSMICKVLQVKPENALNGTTALNMIALQQGARLLRVHDVHEAKEVVTLWEQFEYM